MWRRFVMLSAAWIALSWTGSAIAKERVLASMLTLYEGESKVIEAPGAKRIAIGKVDMVSSTLLQNGEIVLTAEASGETNMQVWFDDGSRESVAMVIVPKNGWREALEIKGLLEGIPGIKISTVGRRVVVDGNLQARDLQRVHTVKERYEDMLILAREITDYEQRMVFFDVKVTEFDRDETEELGINWSKSFAGPSVAYANAWRTKGGLQADFSGNSTQGTFDNFTGGEGFFWGIGAEITSVIDVLEQTGASVTLSEPRLSARSGGSANLTVGGEVPVITSSINGSSVEYKEFGVILGISPMVDAYDNITASISVSVSQVDLANAVEDQPAFRTRKTENDVKLRPGQTLVLAGLLTQEEQLTFNNVKWLADIPVIGNLFKSKSFTAGTTEMVVFITPQLMDDLSTGRNDEELKRAERMVSDFEEFVGYSLEE